MYLLIMLYVCVTFFFFFDAFAFNIGLYDVKIEHVILNMYLLFFLSIISLGRLLFLVLSNYLSDLSGQT